MEIGNYFNYGYDAAQKTHLAFELTDSDNRKAYLYMIRDIAEEVRKKLVAAGGPLKASCVVIIPKNRYSPDSQSIMADILMVKPPVE